MSKYFLLNTVAALVAVALAGFGRDHPVAGPRDATSYSESVSVNVAGEVALRRRFEVNKACGVVTEWTYFVDANGSEVKHGTSVQRLLPDQKPGNRVLLESRYCSGVLDGVTRFRHESGVITHQVSYDQGIAEGLEFDCYESGKLRSVWVNVGERYEGPYVRLFESGRPEVIGEYRSGLKHGVWIQWNEQGEIQTDEQYHFGTKVLR